MNPDCPFDVDEMYSEQVDIEKFREYMKYRHEAIEDMRLQRLEMLKIEMALKCHENTIHEIGVSNKYYEASGLSYYGQRTERAVGAWLMHNQKQYTIPDSPSSLYGNMLLQEDSA